MTDIGLNFVLFSINKDDAGLEKQLNFDPTFICHIVSII